MASVSGITVFTHYPCTLKIDLWSIIKVYEIQFNKQLCGQRLIWHLCKCSVIYSCSSYHHEPELETDPSKTRYPKVKGCFITAECIELLLRQNTKWCENVRGSRSQRTANSIQRVVFFLIPFIQNAVFVKDELNPSNKMNGDCIPNLVQLINVHHSKLFQVLYMIYQLCAFSFRLELISVAALIFVGWNLHWKQKRSDTCRQTWFWG